MRGLRSGRRRPVLIGVVATMAFAVAMFAAGAGAFTPGLPPGQFELDGNAFDSDSSAATADDWSSLFPTDTSSDDINKDFVADGGGNGDTSFTEGSKDNVDLDQWVWTNQPNANKANIDNAMAALYTNATGDTIVYFAMDRESNNGDVGVGIWFFREDVSPGAGGIFVDGNGDPALHQIGDILIESEFTNGGTVPTIQVYKWVGSGGLDGPLDLIFTGVECGTQAASDPACGIVNRTSDITVPWPYLGDSTPPITVEEGNFFEGGINLSQLLNDEEGCFGSFVAKTSASQEVTEALIDFAHGDITTCPDVSFQKTPDSGAVFVGQSFNWSLDVANDGGPASNVVVSDTIPATLQINGTPTFDVDPNTAGGTGNCGVVGQVVTCTIPALAGSDGNTTGAEPDAARITINVTALATANPEGVDCAAVNNTGSVTADDEPEENTGNNSDTGQMSVCRLGTTKNATPAFDRTFDWSVKKYVSTDDACQTGFQDVSIAVELFNGQTDTICWKIEYTKSSAIDSGPQGDRDDHDHESSLGRRDECRSDRHRVRWDRCVRGLQRWHRRNRAAIDHCGEQLGAVHVLHGSPER